MPIKYVNKTPKTEGLKQNKTIYHVLGKLAIDTGIKIDKDIMRLKKKISLQKDQL